MSTRKDQFEDRAMAQEQGLEGTDSPSDIEIPSCTIEDVDRAVFNLFDKSLPLQTKENNGGQKSIPVIFATGERFAVLRRKKPLRDKSGALILPLISIMRTGVTQQVDHGMGPGQGGPITITKRIAKESQIYKRLVNQHGLSNQDAMAHNSHNAPDKGDGTVDGKVGTRRDPNPRTQASRTGQLLAPGLGDNIYETITIPPVKFYTTTYDITLWSQYTQEMNDMMMTIMSLYQNNHQRTFKLETEKGYWFVGFVESDITPGNNVEDFTDDERLIRYSFSIKVGAYVVAPEYPGAPAYARRKISAPMISFSTIASVGNIKTTPDGIPKRNDPDLHLLKDLYSEFDPTPSVGVGSNKSNNSDALNAVGSSEGAETTSLGGQESKNTNSSAKIITTTTDPFTGEKTSQVLRIKGTNQRKGETVLREEIIIDFGDLFQVK